MSGKCFHTEGTVGGSKLQVTSLKFAFGVPNSTISSSSTYCCTLALNRVWQDLLVCGFMYSNNDECVNCDTKEWEGA